MELEFSGEVVYWRGPAPHHFVPVPEAEAQVIASAASQVSYGWGVIPAAVRMGNTDFTTSLFPKDGGYLVPLKVAARRAEGVDVGDTVTLRLKIEA